MLHLCFVYVLFVFRLCFFMYVKILRYWLKDPLSLKIWPPIQAIQIHQSKRFRATCFSGTSDTKSRSFPHAKSDLRHLATLIRLALRLDGGKLHHCHLRGKGSVGGFNHQKKWDFTNIFCGFNQDFAMAMLDLKWFNVIYTWLKTLI